MTAEKIAADFSKYRIKTIEGDFCECKRKTVRLPGKDRGITIVSFGTTFGNFAPEAAVACLGSLHRNVLKPGETALFSLDSTQDTEMIQSAYGNNITAQFFLNGLNYACGLAGLKGLDPDAFSYEVRFNKETKFVEMDLVSQSQQILTGGSDVPRVVLESGESLRVGQSRKLSEYDWKDVFQQSGYEIETCLPDMSRQSRYNIWVVRAGPGGVV